MDDQSIAVDGDIDNYQLEEEPEDSRVLHRSLHKTPYKVVSANGLYLMLSNGQRIMDATSGPAVSCIGHNNARVKIAIMKQMEVVDYCQSMFFGTQVGEDLADELIRGTEGKMARSFIISSGSEAMEAAIKMSRQYFQELPTPEPRRTKFIARTQSWHGATMGALAMSGHVARRTLFEPMLSPDFAHVSFCHAYRAKKNGESDKQYVARLAQELDDEFQRLGPETVCAFVAEPIVGASLGCVPAVPGYFKAMRAVCDKYGALLILDEVMCGMGRSGTLHAWQQEDVVPDLQTIGKGLGAGYVPVAGLLVNARVADVLKRGSGAFSHGQTYQGHPLACAAALEVQRVIREQNLVENVAKMGKILEEGLKTRLSGHPNVGDIRGKGLFWGLELVKDKATKEPFDPKLGVAMGLLEKGFSEPYNISLYPGTGTVDGKRGDHVLLSPPFTVTERDIQKIVDTTTKVIESYFSELQA